MKITPAASARIVSTSTVYDLNGIDELVALDGSTFCPTQVRVDTAPGDDGAEDHIEMLFYGVHLDGTPAHIYRLDEEAEAQLAHYLPTLMTLPNGMSRTPRFTG